MTVNVTRLPIQLLPDPRRVITRYFAPGEVNRIKDIVERLLAFPEAKVDDILATLESNYRPMHPEIDDVFREPITEDRVRQVGVYRLGVERRQHGLRRTGQVYVQFLRHAIDGSPRDAVHAND